MMNCKSVFKYKIIDNHKSAKEIKEKMNEELNRGLAFIISRTDENDVAIAGEWKGWVTTTLRGNNIYIYVDNSFFCSCVFEQILISLWTNLLDFGEVQLEEFQLSDNVHKLLTSGNFNKRSDEKLLRINGPYFGTVFKPSFSLSLSEKLSIAEKFASIGGTFIKEDETYLTEKSKLLKESKIIQDTMNSVSDCCFYVPNVTPYLLDNYFLQKLYNVGIRIVMVNYLIAGLPAVYKISKRNKKLLFWGHRVGYKSIERYISMQAVAQLAAYSGMNMIHIGTPLFSKTRSVAERIAIVRSILSVNPHVLPVFTKVSLEIIPSLINVFSPRTIIMVCGFIRTKGSLDLKKFKYILESVASYDKICSKQ